MSAFAGYTGVFLLIMSLVAVGYQPPEQIKAAASAVDTTTSVNRASPNERLSVDDLVATKVATNIAQTAGLPVATNVANLSQSIAAESVLTQNEAQIVAKPQIVEATADTRDIKTYRTKAGDTVDKVAAQFNLSTRTVRWVNNLSSDALEPNKTLKILPTDGVLHTVRSGDSIESIAERYSANATEIRLYNDLDLGGLSDGKQLIIPGGSQPSQESTQSTPTQSVANNPVASNAGINYSGYSGGSGSGNTYAASIGNRYSFGQCTWYAYERRAELGRPVGSLWGNAATWAYYAAAAGYKVNGTPAVGAVMQNGGGYGHVAVVEAVSPGNYVTISEMNAYRFGGGFNRIGRGNIPWNEAVSGMYRYIHS